MIGLGSRDERFAALGAALARAAAAGEVAVTDAARVMRHELRGRNKRKALAAPHRSVAVQAVIDRYAADGLLPPTNGSPESPHCDHVFALRDAELVTLTTVDAWLARLPELDLVVCVTAAENYRLEQVERKGADGWGKYGAAGVQILEAAE